MKGGVGLRLRSRFSTFVTTQSAPSRCRTTSVAAVSFSRRKVLWSRRLPANSKRFALKGGGEPSSRSAVIVQYSSFTKARISRSRSVMRRTATDCTRPAERPRRTFFQRSGLSW